MLSSSIPTTLPTPFIQDPTSMLEYMANPEVMPNTKWDDLVGFFHGKYTVNLLQGLVSVPHDISTQWGSFQPIAQYESTKKTKGRLFISSRVTEKKDETSSKTSIFLGDIIETGNKILANQHIPLKLEIRNKDTLNGRVDIFKLNNETELDVDAVAKVQKFVNDFLNLCAEQDCQPLVSKQDEMAIIEVNDEEAVPAEEVTVTNTAWNTPAAGALPRPFDRATLLDPADRERLDNTNFNYASELISLLHSWSLSLNASLSVAFQHALSAGVQLDPDQYPGNFIELKYVLEAVRRFSENARAEKRLMAHMTAMISDMKAPAKKPRPQLVRIYRALGESIEEAQKRVSRLFTRNKLFVLARGNVHVAGRGSEYVRCGQQSGHGKEVLVRLNDGGHGACDPDERAREDVE